MASMTRGGCKARHPWHRCTASRSSTPPTSTCWSGSITPELRGELSGRVQTAGRGRRQTLGLPFGCQLILSMYWRLEQGMAAAMGLSLAVGVAW